VASPITSHDVGTQARRRVAKRRVVMNQLVMLTCVSFERSQGCLAVWLFEDWKRVDIDDET